VLRESSGDSWIVRNWAWLRHEWRHEHPLGGDGVGDMVGKDLRLALALGDEVRLPLPSTALAAQLVPLVVSRDEVFGQAPRLEG
jgi:3-hydroxyisobutyrate dehydrogenase-like beta-hydroxyacid dehydrogenase